MRVMKFGGTSLSTPERLKTVCRLVEEAAEKEPVVVVTSAPAGVTDLLLGLLEHPPRLSSYSGESDSSTVFPAEPPAIIRQLRKLFFGLLAGAAHAESGLGAEIRFVLAELEGVLADAARRREWEPASRDRALGVGERLSAHLVSGLLREAGVAAQALDPREIIRTDSEFGSALVDRLASYEAMRQLRGRLEATRVACLPGFTGGDRYGRFTTLGRGSSDLTAALVGAGLSARVVEIWTDVDGIHTVDPKRNPSAPLLSRLDYDTARELAKNGAKVLHPNTLDPLQPLGIPLWIRNTLRPEAPGTRVGPEFGSNGGSGSRGNTRARGESGSRAASRGGGEPSAAPNSRTPHSRSWNGTKVVHLFLAGAGGQVGRALLGQIEANASQLHGRHHLEFRVAGAFSSQGQMWSTRGLPPEELALPIENGRPPDWRQISRRLSQNAPARSIFVDCTASAEVSSAYRELLTAGIPVITANKIGLSSGFGIYEGTQRAAFDTGTPFRYETTVGSALPVLQAVRDRRLAGDEFHSISGVLSGTLSFVFARLREGERFSQAVADARDLGLTEPHPGADLAGADVGRKLLILMREAGYAMEPGDIPVESLIPNGLSDDGSPDTFLARLASVDGVWEERVQKARNRGEFLSYVAWHDGRDGGVGIRSLPQDHPLACPRPTENVVLLETDRYSPVPLAVTGPGAGPELTATGVLTDLLAAIREGGLTYGRLP